VTSSLARLNGEQEHQAAAQRAASARRGRTNKTARALAEARWRRTRRMGGPDRTVVQPLARDAFQRVPALRSGAATSNLRQVIESESANEPWKAMLDLARTGGHCKPSDSSHSNDSLCRRSSGRAERRTTNSPDPRPFPPTIADLEPATRAADDLGMNRHERRNSNPWSASTCCTATGDRPAISSAPVNVPGDVHRRLRFGILVAHDVARRSKQYRARRQRARGPTNPILRNTGRPAVPRRNPQPSRMWDVRRRSLASPDGTAGP
jgi:hypothetical protein